MNRWKARRWRVNAALLLVLILLPPWSAFDVARAADEAAYRITDLGALLPVAINASGQVAGQAAANGRAAIWRDGVLTELPGVASQVNDIDDRGWAVGTVSRELKGSPRAALWRDGAVEELGTLGAEYSEALGINSAGQVVGYATSADGQMRPFLWQDGAMTVLSTDIGEPMPLAWATDINARGEIIGARGEIIDGMYKGEPVVWRDGRLSRLGVLVGWRGEAHSINDAGQIVGTASNMDNEQHAVLWQDGTVRDLGTFGEASSWARDINSRGQIVGMAGNLPKTLRTFLYDLATGTMTDLASLVPPGSGWQFVTAEAINDGGQIVGLGVVGGREHGFLLTPTAPVGRSFPETGQTVGPPFLAYWEAHGGLAINGYPLSPAFTQTLEDGQPYLVQYFERVRLEYHPENAAPYDILLGQFGRHILAGVPGAPTAPVSAAPGGAYFPETGHNVTRPEFLAYWQANGGLAQFGYPLSEEFAEVLEDGQQYTVQYFERARFEWHPEHADTPYEVLLGQFGRRILGER